MWGRPSQPPPQSIPSYSLPPCRRPTLVMVQPPIPLPSYSNPSYVQHPYMLQQVQTPQPIWWDHYPGPSYQQELPVTSPPESGLCGYQSPHFRKRKWPIHFVIGPLKHFYQICALKFFKHQMFSNVYARWLRPNFQMILNNKTSQLCLNIALMTISVFVYMLLWMKDIFKYFLETTLNFYENDFVKVIILIEYVLSYFLVC